MLPTSENPKGILKQGTLFFIYHFPRFFFFPLIASFSVLNQENLGDNVNFKEFYFYEKNFNKRKNYLKFLLLEY